MTAIFTRSAKVVLATLLLACQAAYCQTPAKAPSAAPGTAAPAVATPPALDVGDCPDVAGGFEIGKTYACSCPPSTDVAGGAVYGTLVYAYDSNICAAALHAGVLKSATAGRVSVQMIESPPVFRGSTQNGVKSEVWATSSAAAFQFPPPR